MGLFKSNAEKELDSILHRLDMNMSNNYKDNAQSNFREFEARFSELKESGKLKGAVLEKYERLCGEYTEKLKGYTHKDQKPYWH